MRSGDLCEVLFPFSASYVDEHSCTCTFELKPPDRFILLSTREIAETGTVEYEILFDNMKLWFNIHRIDYIIDHVRRAESYDIPFMISQEVEPGSNSSSLVVDNIFPHTPKSDQGLLLTFLPSRRAHL